MRRDLQENHVSNGRWYSANGEHLHHASADKADANHHNPARDKADVVDGIAKDNIETVLREPAVGRVEGALILDPVLPELLGVDLVDVLRSDGGDVEAGDVDLRLWLGEIGCGHLGEVEVPDSRGAGRPDGAEKRLLLTIDLSKTRGGLISSEEGQRLLYSPSISTNS